MLFALSDDPAGPRLGIHGPTSTGTYRLLCPPDGTEVDKESLITALALLVSRL